MSYPATTAIEYVRQATVHITSRKLTGTGFFVDRNIILTCAHVLTRNVDKVQLQVQGRTATGTVLKRLPEVGRYDGSYPFPDLAFVGLDDRIDHPVAETHSLLLHYGQNAHAKLAAFGFNRDSPAPTLAPDIVRMGVEGKSKGFVKANTETGVVPGMSGAPIVDVSTGLVCGILKYYAAEQKAAWFIDALDIEKHLDPLRNQLGRHEPLKSRLFLPEPGTPVHNMLMAQRTVAEKLPYRVVEGEVPLSTVYVEQRAEAWTAERTRAVNRGAAAPAEPTVIPANEMLNRHRNALVVSGPGGGKSTLLQHLVSESVAWWLRPDAPGPGEEPPIGPAVAIRCAATRLLRDRPWSEAVAEAVNADLHIFLRSKLSPELFESPPRPGVDWLVLVDGLDEVFDPGRRADLIDTLATHIATYGFQARFVVSSRALMETEFSGLRAKTMRIDRAQRLGEYNLRPFDRPAVETFSQKWYRVREPEHAEVRCAGFLAEVDRGRLMTLVSIPLLCTIAADVYQRSPDSRLPSGRTGLYQKFVDGLVDGRQTFPSARVKLRDQLADLGRRAEDFAETLFDLRVDCLTELAWQRLKQDRHPSVELARQWLLEQNVTIPRGVTDDHIREALLSTGLVVNRGDGLEFTHQSIAEYLLSGEVVETFDGDRWADEAAVVGTTSAALFELGRWSAAGNDAMPVVERLAIPGPEYRYPMLPQLAAVLEDGAAVRDDDDSRVAELTIEAVQNATTDKPETLRAVGQAARAVLQRAPDPSPLVDLINDPRTPESKRVEVAAVLLADGDPDRRQSGLDVLMALGYSGRRSGRSRLPALRALAEVGNPRERRSALQHLAGLAGTGLSLQVRTEAANLLVSLGEPADALVALVGRLVDHDRGPADLVELVAEADELLVQTERWIHREAGDASPQRYRSGRQLTGNVWSAPRTSPVTRGDPYGSPFSSLVSTTETLAGFARSDRLDAAVSALLHDRSTDWWYRSRNTLRLDASGLGRFAIELLINDSEAAPSVRVLHSYFRLRHLDPAAADSMLREIVENDRADDRARFCALRTLGSRGGASAATYLAGLCRDPSVSPPIRIDAAATLGRHGRRQEALELLAGLRTDPDLDVRWRWIARWTRWGSRLEPVTDFLTDGRTLTDAIGAVVWGRVQRWLAKVAQRLGVEGF
jgi:hypothetical protein